MKKLLLLLFLLVVALSAISYKRAPTYNPFDGVFDVDVYSLEECDTILGTCGFINLQRNKGRLRPFYQIFCEDMEEVVAKGFTYAEDTIGVDLEQTMSDNFQDSLLNLPINIDMLNPSLEKYGYQYLDKRQEEDYRQEIRMINAKIADTAVAYFYAHFLFDENDKKIFMRNLEYYRSRPTIKRNFKGEFEIR